MSYPFKVNDSVEVRSNAFDDRGEGWHVGVVTFVEAYDNSEFPYKVASPANTDGDGWDWIRANEIRALPQETLQWRFMYNEGSTSDWADVVAEAAHRLRSHGTIEFRVKPTEPQFVPGFYQETGDPENPAVWWDRQDIYDVEKFHRGHRRVNIIPAD